MATNFDDTYEVSILMSLIVSWPCPLPCLVARRTESLPTAGARSSSGEEREMEQQGWRCKTQPEGVGCWPRRAFGLTSQSFILS